MCNLVESFNNWINNYKAMNLDSLMDKIRQLTITKEFEGLIFPRMEKRLKEKSSNLEMDVTRCLDTVAQKFV